MLSFELRKVDDLTSKIKPADNGILSKEHKNRSSNNTIYKNPGFKVASRVLLDVKNRQYLDWVHKIIQEIENFRKNAWSSTKRLFRYLISLSKPPLEDVDFRPEPPKSNSKIDSLADHIEQKNSSVIETYPSQTYNETPDSATASSKNSSSNPIQDHRQTQTEKDEEKTKPDSELTQFEVQEKRILRKLKTSEKLDDWTAWFELGNLYEKYGDIDKATDINRFIMKNGNEKDKEKAANNLIGIG